MTLAFSADDVDDLYESCSYNYDCLTDRDIVGFGCLRLDAVAVAVAVIVVVVDAKVIK